MTGWGSMDDVDIIWTRPRLSIYIGRKLMRWWDRLFKYCRMYDLWFTGKCLLDLVFGYNYGEPWLYVRRYNE